MGGNINRRQFLRRGALVGASLGLGTGCTPRLAQGLLLPPERRFAKANVSWDRIIRTFVGLRPAWRSGFLGPGLESVGV